MCEREWIYKDIIGLLLLLCLKFSLVLPNSHILNNRSSKDSLPASIQMKQKEEQYLNKWPKDNCQKCSKTKQMRSHRTSTKKKDKKRRKWENENEWNEMKWNETIRIHTRSLMTERIRLLTHHFLSKCVSRIKWRENVISINSEIVQNYLHINVSQLMWLLRRTYTHLTWYSFHHRYVQNRLNINRCSLSNFRPCTSRSSYCRNLFRSRATFLLSLSYCVYICVFVCACVSVCIFGLCSLATESI